MRNVSARTRAQLFTLNVRTDAEDEELPDDDEFRRPLNFDSDEDDDAMLPPRVHVQTQVCVHAHNRRVLWCRLSSSTRHNMTTMFVGIRKCTDSLHCRTRWASNDKMPI